jgi:hypothetical protein
MVYCMLVAKRMDGQGTAANAHTGEPKGLLGHGIGGWSFNYFCEVAMTAGPLTRSHEREKIYIKS